MTTESNDDADDSTDLHTRELFRTDEGDDVTLVMDDGSEIDATVIHHSTHHADSGPHIRESKHIRLERDDGTVLAAVFSDGLSGLPDADPFPNSIQLHVHPEDTVEHIPQEDLFGYVEEVRDR